MMSDEAKAKTPATRQEKNLRNLARVAKKVQKKQTRDAELQKEASKDIKKVEAIVKASPPRPPAKKKGLLAKVGEVAGKAWNWFKDGGWTDILSVGATLLDEPSHLDYQLTDGTIIPKGTILYTGYISPESFKDTNLYTKSSLFTYYEFFNTFVTIEGLTGSDHATGALGVFINPDPSQDIHTSDPESIVSMVANFNGAICRLDRTTRVLVPTPEDPLHVNGNDQLDLRLTKQGQLYIIAYTDIDSSTISANVKLNYQCDFAKDSNPVFRPVQQNLLATSGRFNFSDFAPIALNQKAYSNGYAPYAQVGQWTKPSAVPGTYIVPPGTYMVNGNYFGFLSNTSSATLIYTRILAGVSLTGTDGTANTRQYATNMRNQEAGISLGIPGISFSFMFTCTTQTTLSPFVMIGATGFGGTFVPGNNFVSHAMELLVMPLVLYDVGSNDSVNSAVLCKHHSQLPDELKKRRKPAEKTVVLEEYPSCVSEVEEELSPDAKMRLSQYLRQRRLSGLQ